MAQYFELPKTLGLPNEEYVEEDPWVPMLCSRPRPDHIVVVFVGNCGRRIFVDQARCRSECDTHTAIRYAWFGRSTEVSDFLHAICVAKHMISELTQEGNPTHGVNDERPHHPEL